MTPKKLWTELESYYSNLYAKSSSTNSATISAFIKESNQIPKLPEIEYLRNICERKLGYGECYDVLRLFKRVNLQGMTLAVEFYIGFWPLIGTLLADSLNYAFEYTVNFLIHRNKLL